MNLSSRRAWEDSKEKDVDTNDVPESQRGFSSIDGKKEEKAKEVVEEVNLIWTHIKNKNLSSSFISGCLGCDSHFSQVDSDL